MKISKKIAVIGFCTLLIGAGTKQSNANNLLVDVTAQLNYEMQMITNGEKYNPINEENEALRPIIYEGEIYLPEKIIEDVTKINITYEDDSKELYIGEKSEITYFTANELRPYDINEGWNIFELYFTENPKDLFLDGEMYKSGLKAESTSSATKYGVNTKKIPGKVNVLGGYFYVDESVELNEVTAIIMKSEDEGEEILEVVKFKPGVVTKFEVDVRGANIVKIEIDSWRNSRKPLTNLSILDLHYK